MPETSEVRRRLPGMYHYLRRYARKLTRNHRANADDLVQEVCLRALEHEDRYRHGTDLGKWLGTIMINVQRDRARHASVEAGVSPAEKERFVSPSFVIPADTLAVFRDVADAFARLPPRYRDTLTMTGIERRSYRETAAALGIPRRTVMSRTRRAREALRAQLDPAL